MVNESFEKLKLPNLDLFKSREKDVSPLNNFYNWIKVNSNINSRLVRLLFDNKELSLDVSKIYVNVTINSELAQLTLAWLIKTHKMSKSRAENQLSYIMFDIGPNATIPFSMKTNCVYIDKTAFIVNKRGYHG